MPRLSRLLTLVALVMLVIASGAWAARTSAEMSTPTAGASAATLILIEHADHVTEIDLGEPGPSVGDMLVWGPDPLYDEAGATDTGATTQGFCIAFNTAADCLATETILFPDGSTLEFQGIERSGGAPSARTIVGGSGRYLGASGTMTAAPSADLT